MDVHERHHAALELLQEKVDRCWQAAYERAKRQKLHAPRKFADRTARSLRISQAAAWRTHLYSQHGVKRMSPFISLSDMKAMHDRFHEGEQ